MLNSIKFKDKYRTFNKGDEFIFKPHGINLIVGDQGCGKSSLVKVFTEGRKSFKNIASVKAEPCTYYYLDFEKHNPRTKGRIDTQFQIASIFRSHGEVNKSIFEKMVNTKFKDPILIIVDEVDMALSIRSCHKLVMMLKVLEKNNHQVLAILHNPIVISGFDDVLSI